MELEPMYFIGQMSGTSLDGVDLVYVSFSKDAAYSYKIIHAQTFPYTETWKNRLADGFNLKGQTLQDLDTDYSYLLAEIISNFIEKNKIEKLDCIAAHGHTIFHAPEKGYTLQIGNGPQIANVNKIRAICNFRVQDVALGGQGAPLVPIGDVLLFSEFDYCLNLGGFANISFQQGSKSIAYDICPTNIVLNHYVSELDLPYDDRGKIAATGAICQDLLDDLNALPFYKEAPPKSLGIEYVKAHVIPLIDAYNLSTADILCTFVVHSAYQISNVLDGTVYRNCLVTGGGAYNDFLIKCIQENTTVELVIPDQAIIDFKEALVFAFLGYLKQNDEINCLSSVTGASKDHSSGVIHDPL